jgi:C1A family cysteine protease
MKNKVMISTVLILLTFLGTAWARSHQTLEEIRRAIKEKGAKWEAGETWVSRLSPDERKKLLGDLPREYAPMEIGEPLSGVPLPDSFDWRNNNGVNWTTSVKDQSSCGNCWAYASCGIVESKVKLTLNEPDLNIDLSELYLTSCTGRGCESGWDRSSSIQFIKTRGVPDQGCFPGYLPPQPCSDTCNDKFLRSIFIENWYRDGFGIVEPPDVEVIKDRIFNYGPVSVHFEVFEDFYSYHSGVYEHVWGKSEGWHAVVFVGWNDLDSCWIVKNSWGTGWGGGWVAGLT